MELELGANHNPPDTVGCMQHSFAFTAVVSYPTQKLLKPRVIQHPELQSQLSLQLIEVIGVGFPQK